MKRPAARADAMRRVRFNNWNNNSIISAENVGFKRTVDDMVVQKQHTGSSLNDGIPRFGNDLAKLRIVPP